MEKDLFKALSAGAEQVAAWADVLDRINVFPVADGDTGRNLAVSLSPLRQKWKSVDELASKIMLEARGNSGNIAARFFSGFLPFEGLESMSVYCEKGRELAYGAVKGPKAGTILSVFDGLVGWLNENSIDAKNEWVGKILDRLEEIVRHTTSQLEVLKKYGVVDSGALGMFVFFDAFLPALVGRKDLQRPVADRLKEGLDVPNILGETIEEGYCLDAAIRVDRGGSPDLSELSVLGESLVAIPEGDYIKVHFHTDNRQEAKERLESIGDVVQWSFDDLREQTKVFSRRKGKQAIHIMTDAAGSLTRDDAASLGITLLNSYLSFADAFIPETCVDPDQLFRAMKQGAKVSTSQASIFERHQCYEKVMGLYERVLYLCVGSFYTGNYDVAREWKDLNDPHDRMVIIDSGSASGRLGLAVMATARLSQSTDDFQEVIDFARRAIEDCRELIFLDKLHYLATGGRMSKTGAFFGDMLHLKPVVTPAPEGAKKVAVVRNNKEQLELAVERMKASIVGKKRAMIMIEYSDNREWIEDTVMPEMKGHFHGAEFIVRPFSLTSAAHMGPGTWAVAYLPGEI